MSRGNHGQGNGQSVEDFLVNSAHALAIAAMRMCRGFPQAHGWAWAITATAAAKLSYESRARYSAAEYASLRATVDRRIAFLDQTAAQLHSQRVEGAGVVADALTVTPIHEDA